MMGFLSDGWDPFDSAEEIRRRKKQAEAENVASVEGYDPQNDNTKEGLLGSLIDKPVAPWEKEKAEQSTGEYWAKNILGINSLFSPLAKKTHAAETRAYNTAMREAAAEDAARQLKFGAIDEFVTDMTDGNVGNDARAYLRGRANDIDAEDMATAFYNDPMFQQAALDDLPPIMQTAKILMETHNADPANVNDQWTMEDAFNHAKKYDPALVGSLAAANASGAGNVEADLASLAAAQKQYLGAYEQNAVFADSLANIDRGIEMIDKEEVDTGIVNGFLFNAFGIGTAEMGEFNALSKNATIDKLMSFKGPTTDFEFTQSEAAAFASIMKGEPVNEGTLKTARSAIERAMKRNSNLGEASFGTMRDLSDKVGQGQTFSIYEKNYAPWFQQSAAPAEDPKDFVDGVPTFDKFRRDAEDRGETDAAKIRETYNRMYGG